MSLCIVCILPCETLDPCAPNYARSYLRFEQTKCYKHAELPRTFLCTRLNTLMKMITSYYTFTKCSTYSLTLCKSTHINGQTVCVCKEMVG